MTAVPSEISIPVRAGGITFKNPFYVASGPTARSVPQLQRIEETGWAAASIKLSIDPAPYINRKPRYSLFSDRNALAFTAEKRLTFEEGLTLIEEAKPKLTDLILMANITYAGDDGPAGWVNMARRFRDAGADIIELNMCCPNMSYNLELTSGGSQTAQKQTGASMGQHADIAAEIVRAIKASVDIPLFVKLTPEGGQIAHIAKALFDAGADAVGSTANRLGMPPINLDDPGKACYHLQEEISMGCHCGPWLKPLAQRDTYEIRKVCGDAPAVTATGGITNWQDAVEMILCGGTLLGVCAETLISGYDIVRPMINGLDSYMKSHGYTDLGQMRGLVVPQVRTATEVTLYGGYARIREPRLSAPCKSACPHHVPVQAYVQHIARRDFRAAYDIITSAGPLQGLCALICSHPCEDACVRGGFDSPVKIRALKRFVLEYGDRQGWKPSLPQSEKNWLRIAVAGAGASGLACAAELAHAGYDVTVFEREHQAGGALRRYAPSHVLDREALDREIARIEALGVRIEYGKTLGRDFTADSLKREGYRFLFIATGAEYAGSIPEGALNCLDLLSGAAQGEQISFAGKTAVIGPGYPAIEAARTIRRRGGEAILLCTADARQKAGIREALALAREEGAHVFENVQRTEFSGGSVTFEADGTELLLRCDRVYCEPAFLNTEYGNLETRSGKSFEVIDDFAIACSSASNFASIIAAITCGRNAASYIDQLVRGPEAVLKPVHDVKTVSAEAVRKRTGYLPRDRHPVGIRRPAAERVLDNAPVERVMTEEEAVHEAGRCLNCGCGEGCQLCKTICCEFAPGIIGPDTLAIDPGKCVACGMCFNRCPNGNIEMVSLGVKV